MKLKFNLLAGAAIVSAVSLAAFAQSVVITPPALRDGSNASRAPLPVNQPTQYVRVTNDEAGTTNSVVAARHIDGATSDQFAASIAPSAPAPQIYAATPFTEPVLSPTGRITENAGASLGAAQMSSQIRSGANTTRDQLLDIESRITASDQSMATTRGTMPALSTKSQEQFKTANDDVKAKEQALRQSISAARNATSEQVAADYEAYAAAVDRVDVLVSAKP